MKRIKRILSCLLCLCLVAGGEPVLNEPHSKAMAAVTSDEVTELERQDARLSRTAAAQSMVLLENEGGVLPLRSGEKIALFGAGSFDTRKGGTGSGDVNERESVNIWDGLIGAGFQITSSDYLAGIREQYRKERAQFTGPSWEQFFMEDPPISSRQIRSAREGGADTAIYVISRSAGEGQDRTSSRGDYYLSKTEEKNLKKIAKSFEKTIVVLNVPGMTDTGFFHRIRGLDAMILMGMAGMEGGNALADVLTGEVTPSGKLSDTWAASYQDYPSCATYAGNDGNTSQEVYSEGIYVGYRYFDSCDIEPAYPFGYGLSYTDFRLDIDSVTADCERIRVEVTVTNTGDTFAGAEVVQVYYSAPEGEIRKAFQNLAGFAKTDVLEPGQAQTLSVSFPTSQMASYDTERSAWVLEKGDYLIRVGNSSRNTAVAAVASLDQTVITRQLSRQMTGSAAEEGGSQDGVLFAEAEDMYRPSGQEEEQEKAPHFSLKAEDFQTVSEVSPYDGENAAVYVSDTTQTQYLNENLGYSLEDAYRDGKTYTEKVVSLPGDFSGATLEDVYNGTVSIEEFVSGLTVSQMADLVVGGSKLPDANGQAQGAASENASQASPAAIALAAANSVQGEAGETAGIYIESKKIPNITLADGPAGVRLTREYEDQDGTTCYQFATAWPSETMLACAWDTQLMRKVGEALGEEMVSLGITLLLAPGMNIHRNPLGGRNFEYYSEDPYLSGMLGSAMIEGIQTQPGVGACVKHFVCNSQESDRMSENNVIDEQTLREIYLKGFETAIKNARPMAVMAAYNSNNGVPSADDYDLITDVLQGEWGYDGLVLTDWGGGESVPSLSLHAGTGLIMPGSSVEDISVRAFTDEAPYFQEGHVWPDTVAESNALGSSVTVQWGEFHLDPDGRESVTRTVPQADFDSETVLQTDENGQIVRESVTRLLEEAGSAASVEENGDGTVTVTYHGYYDRNNISLGDLQKATISLLRTIMKSMQFQKLLAD